MSDVKFWDAGGGIVLPHLVPKSSHGRQSDSLLCLTGSIKAALQLRRAAVSLGRGVVLMWYVILTNVTRSCGEAASCPVDLKLFA